MWTRESIRHLLLTNDRAVERAMVALLERQTQDEQRDESTRHDNQRGFNCCHAKRGTCYGKWVRSGRDRVQVVQKRKNQPTCTET